MSTKTTISYRYNKNLPIVKEGWKGNIYINGQFSNDIIPEKPPLWDVIKWKFGRNPQQAEKDKDNFKLPITPIKDYPHQQNSLMWLGHAAFLLTFNESTILIDPCFADIPTAKRKVAVPCPLESLNNIDYLLISHDHRDHFDKKTIASLIAINPNIEALLPLNMGNLFSKFKFDIPVQEAGWYQEYKVAAEMRIIFLPANHWGRRGAFDYNKNLWGSFLIITPTTKIFFAGDTSYNRTMFKEIQAEFGDMNICMLPIGAYAPKFMMETSHATPEEAVQIFNDLGGKIFIPMHYGTYDLSDEPLGEPIRRLEKCFNPEDEKLRKLAVGEVYLV